MSRRSQDSPTAAVLGRVGPAGAGARAGRAAVGRDRGRGRAQRARLRRLSRARGQARAGARGAGAGRRRLHAGGALARRADVALRLRRGAAASAGDARARPQGPRVPLDARRTAGCSCRSRTGAASSSGTTTSAARRRSAASPRATSPAGGRCRRSSADSATRSGPDGPDDIWIGPSPTREAHRAAPGRRRRGARPAVRLVDGRAASSATSTTSGCSWPTSGQGVIGTNASPHDPGTASIYYHHASGPDGRAGRAPGATSRAAWGWSRSSCATSRARPARWSPPGVPVAAHPAGRGRRAGVGRADPRAERRLQRRPARARSALLDGGADPAWADAGARRSRSTA